MRRAAVLASLLCSLLCSLFCLAGCDELLEEPAWVGSYTATGTWDVSGPLAGGRTAGDAVADLLVDQLVSLSGVPSMLEDKAHEGVSALIRDKVKAAVDGVAPPALKPGGTLCQLLAASLAGIKVESTIELDDGLLPGSLKGTETLTGIEYQAKGVSFRLTAADLHGTAGATIVGELSGKEDGSLLVLDPHGFEIRFGELVNRIAGQILDLPQLTSLKSEMESAVSCSAIVTAILGGGSGVKITVAEWSYTFAATDLEKACGFAAEQLKAGALGLFKIDSKVEVGGSVSWSGSTLASAAGFGGHVRVAPKAIAPRVAVSFTASKLPR
jgi:hypothetical protein